MEMSQTSKVKCGSSDARERQGGGIVPAPPRSCDDRKSSVGLSAALPASGVEDRAIAEIVVEGKTDRREKEVTILLDGRILEKMKTFGIMPQSIMDSIEDKTYWFFPDMKEFDLGTKCKVIAETLVKVEEIRECVDGAANQIFCAWEELIAWLLIDEGYSKELIASEGTIYANAMRMLASDMEEEKDGLIENKDKKYQSLESKYKTLAKKFKEVRTENVQLKEELERAGQEKEASYKEVSRSEIGTQVTIEEEMEVDEDTGDRMEIRRDDTVVTQQILDKKIEEISKRLEKIEDSQKTDSTRRKNQEKIQEVKWSRIVGRRPRKEGVTSGGVVAISQAQEERRKEMPTTVEKVARVESRKASKPFKALEKKLPKGAGVIIELQGGKSEDYVEVIKECEKKISLEELGIPPLGVRKTRGGGMLVEIRSTNEEDKAEELASRIKEVVKSREGAKVWCPLKRVRLRLMGLPLGARPKDIAEAISNQGGGRMERIRVGPVRTNMAGLITAWADCPISTARRIAETSELVMGWTRVGVSIVGKGEPKCYRCLAHGHLGRWCPSEIDRGHCCLRCGEGGHRADRCTNAPNCPVCVQRGLRADHRPGDPSKCRPVPPGAARICVPPGGPPPTLDPGEGTGGGVDENGRESSVASTEPMGSPGGAGDYSVDGTTWDPGEGSREVITMDKERGIPRSGGGVPPPGPVVPPPPDPGEGSGGDEMGPAAGRREATSLGRPSGRLWGMDVSPSPSTDMEVEGEGGVSRKRKGEELTRCSVVLAPLPPPEKKGGKGKKKKK